MSELTRALIDGLMPKGSAHRPVSGGPLDLFLEGLADNSEAARSFMQTLASIRDPLLTPIIDDIEQEFGITKNPDLSDSQRRTNVAERKFNVNKSTLPALQKALDNSGFGAGGYGLIVYDNNGQANPVLGGGWNLIVNGEIYQTNPNYFGAGNDYCGNQTSTCGYFLVLNYYSIQYPITTDPNYWPMFFFLGTGATYSGLTITSISAVSIPLTRKNDLYDIILRWKPLHSWCMAYITWT